MSNIPPLLASSLGLYRLTRWDIYRLNFKRWRLLLPFRFKLFLRNNVRLMPWDFREREVKPGMRVPFAVRKDVMRYVHNPKTPLWILEALCCEETVVRSRTVYPLIVLATDPRVPSAGLAAIADHVEVHVRFGVASNPSTPVEVLRRMVHDRQRYVLIGLKDNPSLPDVDKTFVVLRLMSEGVVV